MRKLMKKKVNLFGKGIPVFVIALFAVALVSAALITSWGTITGFVTVNQGFQVGGEDWDGTQVEWSDTLTSLEEKTISSGDYSLVNSAPVDAKIKLITACADTDGGCEDVTITEMVKLGVVGYDTSAEGYSVEVTPFERDHYKALDYMDTVSLDTLDIVYSFKITDRTGAYPDTLFPYIVIVGDNLPHGVIVQMVPDGGTYEIGEEYTKTLEGATFHIPGCSVCTQQSPCTIEKVKTQYSSATINRVRLAFGAWPGVGSINILMGIDTISGQQTGYTLLTVGAGETSSLRIVTDFPKMIKPDTYTFTTEITPAE